jgi:5-oxoprolinase (ATP-hydrolysing)
VGTSQRDGVITRSFAFDILGNLLLTLVFFKTIAGGSGAGPNWHGTSGVHTHITNTRIGDVEILERRYPVLVHEFGLRNGSAGVGKWRGGEGVKRVFEVTEKLRVSILSEVSGSCSGMYARAHHHFFLIWKRRARQPYGVAGGGPGALGRNTWVKKCREEDGDLPENVDQDHPLRSSSDSLRSQTRTINIGGKATIMMGKGDKLLIETPGGGAWGAQDGEPGNADAWKPEWSARGSVKEREAAQAEF